VFAKWQFLVPLQTLTIMDLLQGVTFHNAVGLYFMLSLCYYFLTKAQGSVMSSIACDTDSITAYTTCCKCRVSVCLSVYGLCSSWARLLVYDVNNNQLDACLSSVHWVITPLHVSWLSADLARPTDSQLYHLPHMYILAPDVGLLICPKHVEVW
jgi:hypothetical protein